MKFLESIKLRRLIVLLVFAMSISLATLAQPSDQDQLGDADVPIDGGLTLALAAGAGYLAKRRHDAQQKKKANKDKEILP